MRKTKDASPCKYPLDLFDRYDFRSYGHAMEILSDAFPEEWKEIYDALTNFSVVAWLKGGAPQVDYGTLFAQGGLGVDGFACYLITNRAPAAGESALRLAFQTRKDDAVHSIYADYASEGSDGLWHQIAVTHDFGAKVKRLYVDGVLRDEKTGTPFPNPQNTARFFVGARHANGGSGHALKGRMAEVSLWDRPLSSGEIKSMRRGPLTGHESGLIGYWPFTGDRRISPDRVANGSLPHDFVLLANTSLVSDKVGWRKGGTMLIIK